jgi:hypothetical protein
VSAVGAPTRPRRQGRPPACPHELALRVVGLRRQGLSLQKICDVLNAENIPTPQGRPRWLKSHVDGLLHTQHVRDILEEFRAE